MMDRKDALSGASLFSGFPASRPEGIAHGRAGASRDKMHRASRSAARRHLVSGLEAFSVSALTALRMRYGPSRPKPSGETPKDFHPAPAERRALRHRFWRGAVTGVRSGRRIRSSRSQAEPIVDVCRARRYARNPFFSLLPAGLSAHASRNAPGAARITRAHNAGREAACIVRARARQRSAGGMLQISLAWRLILGFTFGRQRRGPYAERRTSCVLYDRASCRMPAPPTRLPGSFAPVDPDQRGDIPPCWIPPGAARRGAIA
jgi:hypothetical protein